MCLGKAFIYFHVNYRLSKHQFSNYTFKLFKLSLDLTADNPATKDDSTIPSDNIATNDDISANEIVINDTNSNSTENVTQSTTGKVDENKKKFPCKYCEKSYTQSHSRKTHMINVQTAV